MDTKPHWLLTMSEAARSCADVFALRRARHKLRNSPRGDGHAVMVIPGFLGDDSLSRPLIQFLRGLGYRATGWRLGRNLGPTNFDFEQLQQNIRELSEHVDGSVSLIGHSLGGIYAREVAREMPEIVRQVMTLGSPFGLNERNDSAITRLFLLLNGDVESSAELQAFSRRMPEAPPVPTTAVYTRGDGIVHWQSTVQRGGHDRVENIQVRGSHAALVMNAMVWHIIADRLAQPKGHWSRYRPSFSEPLVLRRAARAAVASGALAR